MVFFDLPTYLCPIMSLLEKAAYLMTSFFAWPTLPIFFFFWCSNSNYSEIIRIQPLSFTKYLKLDGLEKYSSIRSVKVCIIQLDHILKKNLRQLFDKYAVAQTEHNALFKSTTKIFSNFVAFSENQKTQTLNMQDFLLLAYNIELN